MGGFTIPDVITKLNTDKSVGSDATAYVFDGEHHSYSELQTNSNQLAAGLINAGLTKGDRVGVLMRNRPEWLDAFFGITRAGGVVVPLNYLLHSEELKFILDDCDAKWLLFESEFEEASKEIGRSKSDLYTVSVDEDRYQSLLLEAAETVQMPTINLHDYALFQYTSGTTGRPKGAIHTHSTVLWNSFHQVSDFQITCDNVCYVTPALCWAAGLHDLALATLWVGGRLVLTGASFEPSSFLETVERERVTTTLLVPTVLKRVLDGGTLANRDLSSLRLVISGGEPVPITASNEMHEQLPGCDVLQVYGLSEFPTLMLTLDAGEAQRKAGSTGKACSIAQVRIVDAQGNDAEPGEPGEIICKSPAVMRGYHDRPEANAFSLSNGWLHTGDLATVDHDGYVFIAGREKDMIITGGLNVYPAEIERVLAEHPAIIEAAVVGISDDDWGEVGQAHIVRASGHDIEETELVSWLRSQLGHFKTPRNFIFRDDLLPRTTSGKVQKFRLHGE